MCQKIFTWCMFRAFNDFNNSALSCVYLSVYVLAYYIVFRGRLHETRYEIYPDMRRKKFISVSGHGFSAVT